MIPAMSETPDLELIHPRTRKRRMALVAERVAAGEKPGMP